MSGSHVSPSGLRIRPDMPLCQRDLPLDRYQDEFRPYAEEYLALPDRNADTVLCWLDGYVRPALDHFGPSMMLLAHYYMGGEIVKLVERYGGRIADSYELALQTRDHPEVKIFVESAVHFMAESIAILANPDQDVWITNPKSGCTMEMMAKDWMVEPAYDELRACYGDDLMVLAYMNTSGRVKALAGETGGSVCTSSNAAVILRWALKAGKRIFFVPDRHLGENVAAQVGLSGPDLFHWQGGEEGGNLSVNGMSPSRREELDRARMILWGGSCGVHTLFRPDQAAYWQGLGYRVLVHPECPKPVVDAADGAGSTKYLWEAVMSAEPGKKLAIATEGHFVRNAQEQAELRGVTVVNMADMPNDPAESRGCGCATMSRNDPPHLAAMLDLLRQGKAPDLNHVLPGDVVSETVGTRDRLSEKERSHIVRDARRALETMIAVTRRA
ncbi:quinolinate synthase NadA [bacterium]|nr:quinolinate synthase NadA [bacterium]